jgi:hypothetical protein
LTGRKTLQTRNLLSLCVSEDEGGELNGGKVECLLVGTLIDSVNRVDN